MCNRSPFACGRVGSEFLNFFECVNFSDTSATAPALRNRQSIVIEDVMRDPQFGACCGIVRRAGIKGVQSTPLLSTNGALVGIPSTPFPSSHRPTGSQMLAVREAARGRQCYHCASRRRRHLRESARIPAPAARIARSLAARRSGVAQRGAGEVRARFEAAGSSVDPLSRLGLTGGMGAAPGRRRCAVFARVCVPPPPTAIVPAVGIPFGPEPEELNV
jgi:hypothetical protein